MKNPFITIALIVLNTLAFSAGIWAAFGSMWYSVGRVDLLPSILFLAVLPSPLVFVWRSLRDRYGFTKRKFWLCTILPQYIVSVIAGVILSAIGAAAGGMGSLAVLAFIVVIGAANIGLIVCAWAWVEIGELCERIKSDRVRKVLAIILLIPCGVFICGGLRGLLDSPLSGLVSVVYTNTKPYVVSYITGILRAAVILAIPLGFGASALMRIYREEYSLKAPLFVLCAFLPTLLISGGMTAAKYYSDKEHYFHSHGFTESLDTLLFTAAIAVMSAVIYAVSALIRSRRHYY